MILKSLIISLLLYFPIFQSFGQNSVYIQKDSLMVRNKDGLSMIIFSGQIYDTDSISPNLKNDSLIIRSTIRQVIGKYDCIEICKTRRNEIIYEIEKSIRKSGKITGKVIHFEIFAIDVDDRIKEAFEKKAGKDPFIK